MVYPTKVLLDGRVAEIIPLTFGRARVVVSFPHEVGLFYHDGW